MCVGVQLHRVSRNVTIPQNFGIRLRNTDSVRILDYSRPPHTVSSFPLTSCQSRVLRVPFGAKIAPIKFLDRTFAFEHLDRRRERERGRERICQFHWGGLSRISHNREIKYFAVHSFNVEKRNAFVPCSQRNTSVTFRTRFGESSTDHLGVQSYSGLTRQEVV